MTFNTEEIPSFATELVKGLVGSPDFQKLIQAEVKARVETGARLTRDQLAAKFEVTPATISDWVKTGKIQRYYPVSGKIILFDLQEVYQDIDHYNGTHRNPWYKKLQTR